VSLANHPDIARKIVPAQARSGAVTYANSFEKKKLFFDFFFSNSRLLCNKQLGDYLRKLKKRFS